MRQLFLTKQQQFELLEAVLQKAGCLRLSATGPSMGPTIFSGDALEVRPHGERFVVGKIYLFRTASGHLYAHRLLRRVGADLIFKGDGLTLADLPVPQHFVLGVVSAVWRETQPHPRRIPLGLPGCQAVLAFYHWLRPWLGVARRRFLISR